MYVPPHFGSTDDALADEIIARHGFATLVTAGDDGPFATHVPLVRDGRRLLGHVARANPQWRDLERAPVLAIFHGPHAYVSPRSYAPRPDGVPTWNYVAVHVRGAARLLPAPEDALDIVERLTAQYDPSAPRPERDAALKLARAIVAFELAMDRVMIKLKLSQNRSDGDFAAVQADLASSDDADARAVAAWMRRFSPT